MVQVLPLAGRITPAVELLSFARQNLRCIDWDRNVMHELITGEVGGHITVSNLFDLARPLRPGEQIDFFMSHSWYANASQKFARLEEISEKFRQKHGRFPTYWLDKVRGTYSTATPTPLKLSGKSTV